jgi:hypothetical protein
VKEAEQKRIHYGIVNFERRKFPRFTIDLPVEYQHEGSERRYPGRALNASEGGLLVYLPERQEVGEVLRLKIFFTIGQVLKTIEMAVQVAWIDIYIGEGWGDYRTGVKFLDISSEDLIGLKDFLKGLSE